MSRILLVAEGPSDLRRVRALIEARVGAARQVVGPDDSTEFLKRSQVTELARRYSIRVSEPGLVGQIRTALLLVRALERRWDQVVVLFDSDGRMVTFGLSLEGLTHGVAIGVAHECGEAWLVEGYQPTSAQRREYRRTLGFDPFAAPERLSHKENHPKSAKTLVRQLALSEEAALARLWSSGGSASTGSRSFLADLAALLEATPDPPGS